MTRESSYSIADLRAIADAGVSLTSELYLEAVLQKLVDVARGLVNSRYAAMSVVGGDGGIEQFIFTGISEEDRERIGDLPRGRGLLAVLLQDGTSLRLDDMSKDPRSAGFPANHPPMRSLLGVPLVSRGRIIGNLYLTEKAEGARFTDRDEEIVRILAAQAAAAIDNAEIYQSEYRLAQESKALFELGRQVSSSHNLDDLLSSVAARARELLRTDVAAIVLHSSGNAFRVAAHAGLSETPSEDLHLTDAEVQTLMEPLVVSDADKPLRTDAILFKDEGLASFVCIPLRGRQGPLGAIAVGNRDQATIDKRAVELLEALANYTGVAIETAQLQERLESLARLEERDRIAMDMHDGVIQSVYAVALHLEDASERLAASPDEVKPILDRSMDDLHQVIKDIRSYIFDLRPKMSEVEDLRSALMELAEGVRINTLMAVEVEAPESLDGILSADHALGLFHIAQEALNNISKHSQATSVQVRVAAEGQRVWLEIEDNGVGFDFQSDRSGEKHGMRNMKDRSKSMGAHLFLDSEPGHGTIVRVELPLSQTGDDI